MDLIKYKQNQEECKARAEYYDGAGFPILAEGFRNAATAIGELIELIEKVNADPIKSEEGANE